MSNDNKLCCPKGGKAKRRLIRENYPELEREWQRLDEVACMSNKEVSGGRSTSAGLTGYPGD